MLSICVASENPVKTKAVQLGFQAWLPHQEIVLHTVSVDSQVSAQPMTEEETRLGAFNRSKNAKKQHPQHQFWVGIEGGVSEYDQTLYTFAWICILAEKSPHHGYARSATFQLPEVIATLVRNGMELGDADDQVFKRKNSKQENGSVGLLTNNLMTRTDLYVPSVVLALTPFMNMNSDILCVDTNKKTKYH